MEGRTQIKGIRGTFPWVHWARDRLQPEAEQRRALSWEESGLKCDVWFPHLQNGYTTAYLAGREIRDHVKCTAQCRYITDALVLP